MKKYSFVISESLLNIREIPEENVLESTIVESIWKIMEDLDKKVIMVGNSKLSNFGYAIGENNSKVFNDILAALHKSSDDYTEVKDIIAETDITYRTLK